MGAFTDVILLRSTVSAVPVPGFLFLALPPVFVTMVFRRNFLGFNFVTVAVGGQHERLQRGAPLRARLPWPRKARGGRLRVRSHSSEK